MRSIYLDIIWKGYCCVGYDLCVRWGSLFVRVMRFVLDKKKARLLVRALGGVFILIVLILVLA